jgi:hypothetical protein
MLPDTTTNAGAKAPPRYRKHVLQLNNEFTKRTSTRTRREALQTPEIEDRASGMPRPEGPLRWNPSRLQFLHAKAVPEQMLV